MLRTSLEISKICANLLSNNRITDDGEEAVDCRGHPIAQSQDIGQIVSAAADAGENGAFEDYENLILVGVWLAVKENGEMLQRLIKWSDLPTSATDESKFLVESDVHYLCDCFLEMLFQAKHRGAISITADTFAFINSSASIYLLGADLDLLASLKGLFDLFDGQVAFS